MKKSLSLLLAIALVFGMFSSMAFAAEEKTPGQLLNEAGVILGNGTDLKENETWNRQDMTVLMSRLFGVEEEAKTTAKNHTFADVTGDFFHGYITWAVEEGLMKGYSATKFGFNDELTAQQFATVLLRVFGIDNYDEAVEIAIEEGYLPEGTEAKAKITRGVTYTGIVNALNTEVADGKTLGQLLELKGFEKEEVPAELKVDAVAAINLKQVKVTFNTEVVKADAEKIDNYDVFNAGSTTDLAAGGSAAVQADGKSVIVTLGGTLNNGTTATVAVKGYITYSNNNVVVSDTTVPSVLGVAVSGPSTFTVEYSEPITSINAAEYTVDNGNYIVTGAVANGSNKVDVTVGVNLTEGEHTVKINGSNVTDYAGYKVVPRSIAFTMAKDTVKPTVSVKSASPTEVKLVFSKPVTNVKDANVLYRHTFNSNNYEFAGTNAAVTINSTTEITIDFSTKPIPLGANKVYLSYSSGSGTMIQDLWGNKLDAVALDVNISMDVTKPAVKEVKFVDAQTLKVIFTKAVDQTTAETEANFSVKDSGGSAVAVNTATRGGTGNDEVTLAFAANALGGGNYTVEVKNVQDTALVKNTMETYTTTLAINDTVRPTVQNGKHLIDNSGATKKVTVYVPFSEAMDIASLTKGNFLKNVNGGGVASLGSDDTVTVAADGKSVTLVITNGAVNITTIAITVGAVKDVAGNGLASFTAIPTLTGDAIAVEKVEAIAKRQIKVTFDGRLSSVSATGYSFVEKDGSANGIAYVNALSVASHSVNGDGKSEVVFNLGADLAPNAQVAANKIQLVVNAATGTKSFLGTQVTDVAGDGDTVIAAVDLRDKIAPTVVSVTRDSATQITVTFDEALAAGTFAATLNGFSVTGGGTLNTVAQGTATTVVLTGTDFAAGATKVSYNAVAGITDVAGNKLADFADKTAN